MYKKENELRKIIKIFMPLLFVCALTACSVAADQQAKEETPVNDVMPESQTESAAGATGQDVMQSSANDASSQTEQRPASSTALTEILPGQVMEAVSRYTDANGDAAFIPAQFKVSEKEDEQTICSGLVVIGPDGSEFVWIPTTVTPLAVRDFGRYFSGGDISGYYDETELADYQEMISSTNRYGGFYLGRYEASKGDDGLPFSKRVSEREPGRIWVQFSPQDATVVCKNLYAGNETVQGFFPWGINWDTTLQWLIDSGSKSQSEVASDSASWGNYSDDSFSEGARGNYTGVWEEAKANNIYDLAGNNWEWTQERYGSNYVMRGGGYNLMGGACPGSRCPAALRDPLPGNNHHPNVTFRAALFVK